MNFIKAAFLVAVSTLITIAPPSLMMGQGVDDQMLLHPPADSLAWISRRLFRRRHSPLTQITPQNVKNLGLAWAFQTIRLHS